MPLSIETDERSNNFNQYVSICDQDFHEEDDSDSDSCVSSSSSLGRNSDDNDSSEDSSDREDSGGVEVKTTKFKGPLDTIKDLEEDLPVKKGISKFYSGKSKSFTSLADAAGETCVQKIVKPEDPYAKKRKDSLARNLLIGRSRSYANVGGISNSKRASNLGRRTSCLNLNYNADSGDEGKSSISTSISPPCPLPPLHRQPNRLSATASLPRPAAQNTPLRSYSWSDLNSVAEGHDITGLAICSGNKGNKVH
ncbi:hypothetical protein TSUD_206530 [Trifolium subterraneum]|uniref:Uncharacterized protein n=1 Tax=Trifolium subterraneum TaxID=3900 RepID=A0A2Z6MKY6_TRISU|nr:hypothetical protein TSUD_206530 [Trifolium subterraneum]